MTMVAPVAAGPVVMGSGVERVRAFRPLVEPRYEAGECMVRNAPRPGVRTFTVHYPSRKDVHTLVNATLNASGSLIRYRETRGAPRPVSDPGAMQQALRGAVSTHVSLDFVTGEATASNTDQATRPTGVMGSVKEFERFGIVGNVAARADSIRALCESQGVLRP